jgi:octaprenyl-diphosphate synthase
VNTTPTADIDCAAWLDGQMALVDGVIGQQLHSDVALVNQIGQYIVGSGGKRVRPRLLLMVAAALGHQGPQAQTLAAVVEFIHTATLLHDDVVDESDLRRGRQTANAMFGNAAAVLVGDFLYSRAFQMMVSVQSMSVLDILANATNVIAEGEVLQLMNMHDPDLAVADYLKVIRYKTAKLFEASAELGAVLAGGSAAQRQRCAELGRHLGTTFQLMDDLLDYDGQTEALGKNVGDDLREGKATLPLLLAMQHGTDAERALVRQAIENGEVERLPDVVAVVRRTRALEGTRQAAEREADLALQALHTLPPTPWKDELARLARWSTQRSS